MAVIFYFSSLPGLRYSESNIPLEIFLRKGAHVVEYLVLTFLIWRVFYRSQKLSLRKALLYSFIFSFLYAASDEWHQTLVPQRAGKIIDVIFDSLSVLVGIVLVEILMTKKITRRKLTLLVFLGVVLVLMEFDMMEQSADLKNTKKELERGKESISQEAKKIEENVLENEKNIENAEDKIVKDVTDTIPANHQENLPSSVKIDVPFTSQAPFGQWDAIHEETCEEASLIMIKYYMDKKSLTPQLAEEEIQKMVAYEIKNYGDYKDTNAQQNVDFFNSFYGRTVNGKKLKVVYDFQAQDIKKYLAKGNPIIIPAAGRELGNPNFTPPGPLYHNLVLTGYKDNTIISNDPGTRKGKDYSYDLKKLYKAIHDFPGKPENIDKGRKAMIVLEND